MSHGILWYLHDSDKDETQEKLSFERLLEAVRAAAKLESLSVWCSALTTWIPVSQTPEVMLALKAPAEPRAQAMPAMPPVPTPPSRNGGGGGNAAGYTGNHASQGPRYENQRRSPRYDRRYKVILAANGVYFRSFTKNISLGGALLENTVPPAFSQALQCEIFLAREEGGEQLRFTAKVLASAGNPLRIAFDTEDQRALEVLGTWISSGASTAAKKELAG